MIVSGSLPPSAESTGASNASSKAKAAAAPNPPSATGVGQAIRARDVAVIIEKVETGKRICVQDGYPSEVAEPGNAMIIPDADLKFARNALIFFAQNAALARSVKATQRSPLMWRLMQGNALDTWVLNWCVLFGSDNSKNQPLHWKNMFEPDAFRVGLQTALGVAADEWLDYRKEVVDYRNELAAHRDLNPGTTRYPSIDTALEAAGYYAEQLTPRLVARGIPTIVLPDLKAHFAHCVERFTEQAAECMSGWIGAD